MNKYKFLYKEEIEKNSKNINISSSMNQSISNFLIIHTFFTSICFYLSKYFLEFYSLSTKLYIFSLALWIIVCILDVVILCILISQLFSVTYFLPLFNKKYSKGIINFVESGGDKDKVYKDWFETYRKTNLMADNFRKRKTKLFKRLKMVAILAIILFTISMYALGRYVVIIKEKEVGRMCREEKEENHPKQNDKKPSKPKDSNPPSAQDQIRPITAAEEPDMKKALKDEGKKDKNK